MKTIADYIGENNIHSLKEILDYAVSQLKYPLIALSTLERYLDLKLITWKQLQMIPFSRNSPDSKQKRKEYALWLSVNSFKRIIYVDGFHFFNIFIISGGVFQCIA
jgi:hypothetical protein